MFQASSCFLNRVVIAPKEPKMFSGAGGGSGSGSGTKILHFLYIKPRYSTEADMTYLCY